MLSEYMKRTERVVLQSIYNLNGLAKLLHEIFIEHRVEMNNEHHWQNNGLELCVTPLHTGLRILKCQYTDFIWSISLLRPRLSNSYYVHPTTYVSWIR